MNKKQIAAELSTIILISVISILLIFQATKQSTVVVEPSQFIIETQSFKEVLPPTEPEAETVDSNNINQVNIQNYNISLTQENQLLIKNIAENFNIDFELILAIIKTESDFQPDLIGDYGNSYGLMQIQPRYWSSFYNEYNCTDWFSIKDNVTVGCAILQYLYNSYSSTDKVLNAYNTGDPNYYNGYSDKVLNNLDKIQSSKK